MHLEDGKESMKKNWKKWLGIGIVGFSTAALATPTPSQPYRIRIFSEPATLDWNRPGDVVSPKIILNIMEGLTRTDDQGAPRPALAEKWTVSKDRKIYTFYLRNGVTWSDGAPLHAQQFVDSWERLLNPKNAMFFGYFLYDVKNAREYASGKIKDSTQLGFRALDARTLQVTLETKISFFPAVVANWVTFPIRKDLIEKHGDKWTSAEKLVVLGPFRVKSWEHGVKVILTRNERYYGSAPKLDEAHLLVVNDDSTAVSMYEAEQLDQLSMLPTLQLDRLKKRPDYREAPYLRTFQISFNPAKKPFDQIKIRQALAFAVDRSKLSDLLGGGQTPTASWIPKGMKGFLTEGGLNFDPKRARELLADAGYPGGKNFPPISFAIDMRDDSKLVAEHLQAGWKHALGIDVEISPTDYKTHLRSIVGGSPPGLFRYGWQAYFLDPDCFYRSYTSTSATNFVHWKNPRYDELVLKAGAETDMRKRLALYREALKILAEQDTLIVPLYSDSTTMLVSPRVTGFKLHYLDFPNLSEVSLEKGVK